MVTKANPRAESRISNMADGRAETTTTEPVVVTWVRWPIAWSGVTVGALAAIAAGLLFGLIGLAIGAQVVAGAEDRVVDIKKMSIGALIFSVAGSFLAFVVGGWVCARIAGIRRSEPAMLHGAVAWLVTLPVVLILLAVGAGSFMGGWQSGLVGRPAWGSAPAVPFQKPDAPTAEATPMER